RWSVALVDIPMIMLTQAAALKYSPHPATVPILTMALFMAFIVPAPTRLSRSTVLVTAAAALAMSAGFFFITTLDPVWLVGAVGFSILVVRIADQISRRVLTIAQHYARAARMQRYFSPAVAERIQRAGAPAGASEHREV